MARIEVTALKPGDPEIAVCARWRVETFGVLDRSWQEELRSLERLVADDTEQVALVAKCGGMPAGTCLLVKSEIDPNHPVTPWLVGLFVTPGYRRNGVGAHLVRAIEHAARGRGHSRLFLYTVGAVEYYRRLGWQEIERTSWKGFDTAFMGRDL